MTRIGLPVPPGFTITTEACRAYLRDGRVPSTLDGEVAERLAALEEAMGRRFGDADDPLLVSVRSGAKFSMPGMMDTVLNVGLSDASVNGLARQSGSERFAYDSYRRLIQMFGKTVLDVPAEPYEDALHAAKTAKGVKSDVDLDAGDLRQVVETFKKITAEHAGREFPQEPGEQLHLAIEAVFRSWQGERAVLYRRTERIPDDLGTAVNIVAMVFGNLGSDSGTGVAFTRDPATGAPGVYGDYLPNAQGEDVVAGIRNTVSIAELEDIDKDSYDELLRSAKILEDHYRDLCDIEFTIERGRLWLLQTRVGKRTAAAAFTIASALADDGLIDLDTALTRVTGAQLAQLMFPAFGEVTDETPRIATGVPASPGAAVGEAVFDAHRAAERAAEGADVILVRKETNPDDLPGMIAAKGILTARGGKTSHAAVVARGMGKTCVCGAEGLDVGPHSFTFDGRTVEEGDVISVDGATGAVHLGSVPVKPSPVVEYFETGRVPDGDSLVAAVHRLIGHADAARRLKVRANADTGDDAARARRFGAAGIGLCRTEHMFLGERRELVERLVLDDDPDARSATLDRLLELQRTDFTEILRAMDGLPVTIRLLDPPLHEFLPSLEDLAVEVAVARERGEDPGRKGELLTAGRRIHEQNPMLGLRGVRLGLVLPGLYGMQVRAIAEAARELAADGLDPRPEIMVPLVGDVRELAVVREETERILADVGVENVLIGTMIEVPRAALTAGRIAEHADFFSFGTNDLTQLGWGFSRDDVEGAFFGRYLELGVFPVSPFETLDTQGIGELVRIAVERGRAARPDLHLGVCGEHGGDPESVRFLHGAGLDYVSCSPFRVPVARLAAGQAAIEERDAQAGGGERMDSR